MERIRDLKHSGIVTVVLFLLAIGLLLAGGIGGARAILYNQAEEDYDVEIDLYHINVKILENAEEPENGILLQNLVPAGEVLELDKEYEEILTVLNPNQKGADVEEIDEYVRVTITKYWEREEDSTDTRIIEPSLIQLGLPGEDSKWIEDSNAHTVETVDGTKKETFVYYYADILPAGEVTEEPFVTSVAIERVQPDVYRDDYTEEYANGSRTCTKVTTKFIYDGAYLVIEAVADAVQTHNAVDAIKFKWGVDATIDTNGTILSIA
ncbi:MAG: hypothetical protein J5744_08520 [Oscillospiraceae bacterium]|nr:hypothetical protein [Oscillospiraceae bacterium]